MRVPVVFVSQVVVAALFGSAALLSSVLVVQTPVRAQDVATHAPPETAVSCPLGSLWAHDDGSFTIDRRRLARSARFAQAIYRIDDPSGYWLYPATGDDVVSLARPDGLHAPVNISIASITDENGVAHTCAPALSGPGARLRDVDRMSHLIGIPTLTATRHIDDPAPCDEPFASGRTVNAVPPFVPREAVRLGVSGTVAVEITLDSSGTVQSAMVQRSPSWLLNAAAIQSARNSQFAPAVFRCKPISDKYLFLVTFIDSTQR